MPAVDFTQWAVPDLTLALGDRTYRVRPPSVEQFKQVAALAVRAEVKLGLVDGPVPDELVEILDGIGSHHPSIGDDVYEQMLADGIHPVTVDRFIYYAVFYWAYGKAKADALAVLLFAPRDGADVDDGAAGGGAAPKG